MTANACEGNENDDPRLLARMMNLQQDSRGIWQPDELGAILRHQLSAPIEVDLGSLDAGTARKLRTAGEAENLLLKSFNDLFNHPVPPLKLLELVKQFAKACANHPDSPLPREVALVLYYSSIIAALVRCDRRITSLDNDALRAAVKWVLAQPWIDDATKSLLQEGEQILRESESNERGADAK